MKYFLSIDYGGTNTKAIIFDEDGNEIGVSSFHTMRKEVKPDYREVDLKETSEAIYDSIKKVLKITLINIWKSFINRWKSGRIS